MDLESERHALYRVPPNQFIGARDDKVREARAAGSADLASSLKKLRKPSVGAWLANVLVSEHPRAVEQLIELGAQLRASSNGLDGDRIRTVSKQKNQAVSELLRIAQSIASRGDQPASTGALTELESTLESAFADPDAAQALRGAQLVNGMHYSGLGFDGQTQTLSPGRATGSSATRTPRSGTRAAAQRALKEAIQAAEQADDELAKAKRAVTRASEELTRLESAHAVALQRSKEARKKLAAARRRTGRQ